MNAKEGCGVSAPAQQPTGVVSVVTAPPSKKCLTPRGRNSLAAIATATASDPNIRVTRAKNGAAASTTSGEAAAAATVRVVPIGDSKKVSARACQAPKPASAAVASTATATASDSNIRVTRAQSGAAASTTSGEAAAAATARVVHIVNRKKGSARAHKPDSADGLHATQALVGVRFKGSATANVQRGQSRAAASATSGRGAANTAVLAVGRGVVQSSIKKVDDRNRVNRAKVCGHGKRKTRCPECIKKMKTGTGSLCQHLKQKGWCLECQKSGLDYYGEVRKNAV
jgi:hypothetical protein